LQNRALRNPKIKKKLMKEKYGELERNELFTYDTHEIARLGKCLYIPTFCLKNIPKTNKQTKKHTKRLKE
jgi:hypothetical protein